MKLRNTWTGKEVEARLTTEHACSSYGQAVIVLDDGEPVDRLSFATMYEIVEASEKEREALGG